MRPNNKCKQLSFGICIYGAVYIHSCLFFVLHVKKREVLYITLCIAVVLLNDFTALNSFYILQYSTMYIIYNGLLVYGNKTRNQKLKREVYSRKEIKLLLCAMIFSFLFFFLVFLLHISHIQHVLFLLLHSFFFFFFDGRSLKKSHVV